MSDDKMVFFRKNSAGAANGWRIKQEKKDRKESKLTRILDPINATTLHHRPRNQRPKRQAHKRRNHPPGPREPHGDLEDPAIEEQERELDGPETGPGDQCRGQIET